MTPGAMGRVRRVVRPAADAIRSARLHAFLLCLLAAAALAVLAPVLSFSTPEAPGTLLRVAPISPADGALPWTGSAEAPGEARQRAVGELFALLDMAARGSALVAGVAILSLAFARAAMRREEIGIRRAVGASRVDLLLAFILEGSAIAALGVIGGLGCAAAGLSLAWGEWPGPHAVTPTLRPGAFLLMAGVLVIGVAAVGLQGRRRRVTTEPGRPHLLLPALQLGLGLATLTASELVLERGASLVAGRSHGQPSEGWVFPIDLGEMPPSERARAYGAALDRLAGMRGVEIASLTSPGAHGGLGTTDALLTDCGRCPTGGIMLPWRPLRAAYQIVSPDTFTANDHRILDGRGFTKGDNGDGEGVVVVNRHLALRHFQNGEAVGRRVLLRGDWGSAPYRVVGVVEDARLRGVGRGVQPLEVVYLSVLQHAPTRSELLLRTDRAVSSLQPALSAFRATAQDGLRPSGAAPRQLVELLAEGSAPYGWFGRLFRAVGWATLAIALVGTAAALARWVQSIAPELALQRALGATRLRVATGILGRTVAVAGGGAVLGVTLYTALFSAPMSLVLAGLPAWAPTITIRLAGLFLVAAIAGAAVPAISILRTPASALLGSSEPG